MAKVKAEAKVAQRNGIGFKKYSLASAFAFFLLYHP